MLPFHAGMQYLFSRTSITFFFLFSIYILLPLAAGYQIWETISNLQKLWLHHFPRQLLPVRYHSFWWLDLPPSPPAPVCVPVLWESCRQSSSLSLWGISLFQLLVIGSVQCGVSLPLAPLYSCLLLQNLCSSLFFSSSVIIIIIIFNQRTLPVF